MVQSPNFMYSKQEFSSCTVYAVLTEHHVCIESNEMGPDIEIKGYIHVSGSDFLLL